MPSDDLPHSDRRGTVTTSSEGSSKGRTCRRLLAWNRVSARGGRARQDPRAHRAPFERWSWAGFAGRDSTPSRTVNGHAETVLQAWIPTRAGARRGRHGFASARNYDLEVGPPGCTLEGRSSRTFALRLRRGNIVRPEPKPKRVRSYLKPRRRGYRRSSPAENNQRPTGGRVPRRFRIRRRPPGPVRRDRCSASRPPSRGARGPARG